VVGPAGTFGNLYQQLISGIAWHLSTADAATLQQAVTNAQTQATSIVQAYVSAYGPPTAPQMQAAQALSPCIATPLDYIMLYAAGYVWAGKPMPPLSLYAMQRAADLNQLLQFAPASALGIIQTMPPYLAALGAGAAISESQSLGAFTLRQIENNLLTPSATNGGITLFNPPSGNYYAGYSIGVTPSQILQDLANGSPQVRVSFSAKMSSPHSCSISFPVQGPIVWGGDLLNISAGASLRGDVARQPGAGSCLTIDLLYAGVAVIPIFPTAWQPTGDASTGWWCEPIIYQASANFQAGSSAPSGFTFVNAIPGGIKLGQDGLGYLSAIIVANPPIISVTFRNGSYAAFSSWLAQDATVSVSLFGFIPFGSQSADMYTVGIAASSPGFTLTLTPLSATAQGQIIPVADQTLPVLAGQVAWAGATAS
jgi:hypothetical protein